MRWLGLLVFGIGGVAVLAAGILLGMERFQLFRAGVHTTGKIAGTDRVTETTGMFDYQSKPGRFHTPEKKTSFFYIVEFKTQGGEIVRFRSDTAAAAEDKPVGTPVDVYYDPGNPSAAQIGTFAQLFGTALAMILAGPVMVLLAVLNFLSKD